MDANARPPKLMQGWTVRVLLISPNTEMLPDPVFPLGLAYVSAALEANQHQHHAECWIFVLWTTMRKPWNRQ